MGSYYDDLPTAGSTDLGTSKRNELLKTANTKAALLGSPIQAQQLSQFRAANPQATASEERYYLDTLEAEKIANRNDSLLGDIGTGIGISFGDRLPQTMASIWALATGSQGALDYVAQQEAEANASRENYSVDTQEAQQNIRDNQAVREASYQGRDRTWGEAAGDFFSTVGDYVMNPAAAAVEAAESADSLAMMATGGGIVGAAAKKGAQTATRNKIMSSLAGRTAGAATDAAAVQAGKAAIRAGANPETVAAALANPVAREALIKQGFRAGANKAAQRVGNEAASKAAGVIGTGYTGLSEGAGNGIQTFNEINRLDNTTLFNSEDFNEWRANSTEGKKLNAVLEALPNENSKAVRNAQDSLKREYALSKARMTAAISGVAAAAVGKLSGASDSAAGALLGKKSGIIKNTLKSGLKEGVEEVGQSGGGQLISNLVVKQADESKDVLKDVGNAAASGLAAGFTSGAAMGATSSTISKAGEIKANAAVRKVERARAAEEKAKQEAIIAEAKAKQDETDKANATLDTALADVGGDPSKLKGAIMQSQGMRRVVEQSDLTKKDNVAKAEAYAQDIAAKQELVMKHLLVARADKDTEKAAKFEAASMKIGKELVTIGSLLDAASPKQEKSAVTPTHVADVDTATTPEARTKVFNSHPIESFSDDNLNKINSWEDIQGNDKSLVETEIAKRAIRNSMSEVDTMVSKGGYSESMQRDMKGLLSYVDDVSAGIAANSKGKVFNAITGLRSWHNTQLEKQQAYEAAWDLYNTPNKTPTQVAELKDLQHFIRTKYNTGKRDPVHSKSGNFIQAIQKTTNEIGNTLATAEDALSRMGGVEPTAQNLRAAKNTVLQRLAGDVTGLKDIPAVKERINQATTQAELDTISSEIDAAVASPKQSKPPKTTSVSPTQKNASESVTGPSKEDAVAANERRKALVKRKDIKGTPTANTLRGINLHSEDGYNRFLELERELSKQGSTNKDTEITPTSDIPVKQEVATNINRIAGANLDDMGGGSVKDINEYWDAESIASDDLNSRGDGATSPWLMADGTVLGTGGDHISLSAAYGHSGYRDMSLNTGAIRATFSVVEDDTPYVSLQVFDDQQLTAEQLATVEDFVNKTGASILYGHDTSGVNTSNTPKEEISLEVLRTKSSSNTKVDAYDFDSVDTPTASRTKEQLQEDFEDFVSSVLNTDDEKVIQAIVRIQGDFLNRPSEATYTAAVNKVQKLLSLTPVEGTPLILKNGRGANIRGKLFDRIPFTFNIKPSSVFNYISDLGNTLTSYLNGDADVANKLSTLLGRNVDYETVKRFKEFHDSYAEALNKVLVVTPIDKAGFEFSNWVNDFRASDDTLNPDMVMAMAAGAFNFIQENAKDSLYTPHSVIDKMVNKSRVIDAEKGKLKPLKPKDAKLPYAVYEALTDKGMLRNNVISNLGRAIVGATGLSLKQTARYNALQQLESSAGIASYEALRKMGILHTAPAIKSEELLKLAGVPNGVLTESHNGLVIPNVAQLVLVTFKKDAQGNLHEDVLGITDTGDTKLVQDLFKIAPTKVTPSVKPTVFGESLQVRGRKFTKTFRDIFNKLNATEREHDSEMGALLDMGGKDLILRAAGWAKPKGLIGSLASSALDRNKGLERELEDYINFRSTGMDSFHLTVSPWSNGRYGWKETINPQSSKIHREFVKQKAFKQEVPTEGSLYDEDKRKFILNVGFGLGFNIEKTAGDREAVENTIQAITTEGPIYSAIKVLEDAISRGTGLTEAESEVVLAGVDAGGEGVHTLATLNVIARYNLTPKGEVFTHSLVPEVDGKTNGTAILLSFFSPKMSTHLKEQLAKVGLYLDDAYTHYGAWKEANKHILDLYQSIASNWASNWTRVNPDSEAGVPVNPKKLKAANILIGDLTVTSEDGTVTVTSAGRNAGKPFVMRKQYNAGDASLWGGFVGDIVIENIYNRIQTAVDTGDAALFKETIVAVNNLIPNGIVIDEKSVPTLNTVVKVPHAVVNGEVLYDEVKLADFELPQRLGNALAAELGSVQKVSGGYTLEEAIFLSIDTEFGDVSEVTKNFTDVLTKLSQQTLRLKLALIDKAYQTKLDKILKDEPDFLKPASAKPRGKETQAEADARVQLVNYKKAYPLTKQEMAAIEDKIANAGIGFKVPGSPAEESVGNTFMPILTRGRLDEDSRGKVNASNQVEVAVRLVGKSGTSNVVHNPDTKVDQAISPTFLPILVQMLDSSMAITSSKYALNADNNHDAKVASDIDAAGNSLNQAYKDVLTEFNPFTELVRISGAIAQLAETEGVSVRTSVEEVQTLVADNEHNKDSLTEQIAVFNNYTLGVGTSVIVGKEGFNTQQTVQAIAEGVEDGSINVFEDSAPWDEGNPVYAPSEDTVEAVDSIPEDVEVEDSQGNLVEDSPDDSSTLFSSTRNPKNAGKVTSRTTLTAENSLGIFDSLAGVGVVQDSAEHVARMKSFISQVVNKVISPINLEMRELLGTTSFGSISGSDMILVNAIHGYKHQRSGGIGKLRMSSQETLTHELAHAALAYGTDNDVNARRELKRIWKLVADELRKPENAQFVTDNQELVNRVINPKLVNGNTDYLHEFGAYYVSNEKFHNFVNGLNLKVQSTPWFAGDTWLAKLTHFFNKVIDLVNGNLLATNKSPSAKAHMDMLVKRIANIEADHRSHMLATLNKGYNYLGNKVNMVDPVLRKAIEKAYTTSRKIPVVGTIAGGVPGAVHLAINKSSEAGTVVGGLANKLANYMYDSKVDVAREMAALMFEAKGITKTNEALIAVRRQAKAALDHTFNKTMATMKDVILDSFDPSVKWTPESRAAMSYLLLKTNVGDLLNRGKTVNEIAQYLTDTVARRTRIASLISEIKRHDPTNFKVLQAQNLGVFMATGKTKLHLPRFNAEHISKGLDGTSSGMVNQIAELASLSAIQEVVKTRGNETAFKDALGIIQNEVRRGTEENGVAVVLGISKDSINMSKEKAFKNADTLRMDGYTSDVIDKRMSMEISTSPNDQELLDKGYTLVSQTAKDSFLGSAHAVSYIYVNPYGGLPDIRSGAINIRNNARKGSAIENASFAVIRSATNHKRSADAAVYRSGTLQGSNVGKTTSDAVAVPSYDTDGNIMSYRYIMSDAAKDSILRRDMDFTTVAAYTRASTESKPTTHHYNDLAIAALKEIADKFYEGNQDDFITISAKSLKPSHKTMWNKLPHEAKESAKKHFGGYFLRIRKDSVDAALGQVQWDVTELWDAKPESLNVAEKAVKFFGDAVVANLPGVTHAPTTLRTVMDYVKHIAKFIKDIIVIRSLVVTLGNTVSNALLLWVNQGIHPAQYVKDYFQSWAALKQYRANDLEVTKIQQKLSNPSLTAAQRSKYEMDLAVRTEEMQNSPIRILIEEGLDQGIEEVSKDEEVGIKTFLPKGGKAEKYAKELEGMVPTALAKGVSNLLMMQGSEAHAWASEFAQVSDFSARYSMISRGLKKGIPRNEIVTKAADLFMDYDMPSGRFTQLMNDLNILMFTKYLFRVQKHILATAAKNPVGVLALVAGTNGLGIESAIFDSVITPDKVLSRVALGGISGLDEAAIMQAIM